VINSSLTWLYDIIMLRLTLSFNSILPVGREYNKKLKKMT
jgi:hypothetical protein